MPILRKEVAKIICNDCGWHIITKNTMGDVLDPVSTTIWVLNTVTKCGKCGSENLSSRDASLLEQMNPIEDLRRVFNVVKHIRN